MAHVGASLADLDTLATTFNQKADLIETELIGAISNLLSSSDWQGALAENFRSEWNGTFVANLRTLMGALQENAAYVTNNRSRIDAALNGAAA